MTDDLTLLSLLKSGAHFGHQKAKWHPKMATFIFGVRNGVHIIDLEKTLQMLDGAKTYVTDLVARGGTLLFVGTKRQARTIVREQAERVGMPFIAERWLGGLLTNFEQIHRQIERLRELTTMSDQERRKYSKKEQLTLDRERERLEKFFGGIQDLNKLPDALFVVDAKEENTAVREANVMRVPIVAIVDTNVNPELITKVIPANDDATRTIALLTQIIADAVAAGIAQRQTVSPVPATAPAEVVPS
ncbi:MAG: 30S ribosomal protein S2 [Candidatus Kerfeldbacteria bacterium]|nr:30S ribosomal protein S2 [Candidatus Kerfeldbacteria bacterium]